MLPSGLLETSGLGVNTGWHSLGCGFRVPPGDCSPSVPCPQAPCAVMENSVLLTVEQTSSPGLVVLGLGDSPGPWPPSSRPNSCVLMHRVRPVSGTGRCRSQLERVWGVSSGRGQEGCPVSAPRLSIFSKCAALLVFCFFIY